MHRIKDCCALLSKLKITMLLEILIWVVKNGNLDNVDDDGNDNVNEDGNYKCNSRFR